MMYSVAVPHAGRRGAQSRQEGGEPSVGGATDMNQGGRSDPWTGRSDIHLCWRRRVSLLPASPRAAGDWNTSRAAHRSTRGAYGAYTP